MADKIIYLDIPLKIRKKRIFIRYIKQKLGVEKSNYKPSFQMLKNMYKWTDEFENNKDTFEENICKYSDKSDVLRTEKQILNYKLK